MTTNRNYFYFFTISLFSASVVQNKFYAFSSGAKIMLKVPCAAVDTRYRDAYCIISVHNFICYFPWPYAQTELSPPTLLFSS